MEHLTADDCRMAVFNKPHGSFTLVWLSHLVDGIDCYGLLQNAVAGIFFILEDSGNHRFAECEGLVFEVQVFITEFPCYDMGRFAGKLHGKDSLYHGCFLGNYFGHITILCNLIGRYKRNKFMFA